MDARDGEITWAAHGSGDERRATDAQLRLAVDKPSQFQTYRLDYSRPYVGSSWSKAADRLYMIMRGAAFRFRKPWPNHKRQGANCELFLRAAQCQ